MPPPVPVRPAELPYQRLDHLHALRGFCALYVVVYHARYLLWAGGTRFVQARPVATWHLGDYLGFAVALASSASVEMVVFFFVLSGFFIRYATRRRPRTAGGFYLNRVVRIYPPFLASLALAAVVLATLATWQPQLLAAVPGHEQNEAMLRAWLTLRYQPGRALGHALVFVPVGDEYVGYNSPYWSLLPEAVFYLLVPLALRHARRYYQVSAGVWALGVAAQLARVPTPLLLDCLLLYNGYFALGSWLYDQLAARPGVLRQAGRVAAGWWALGLPGLLAGVVALAAAHQRLVSLPLAAGLAVLSVVWLLARPRPAGWLFGLLHEAGRFSFSLYLYHFPLLLLAYAVQTQLTGRYFSYQHWYLLAVPVVVAASYGLYWLTERPAVRYFRGM